MKDKREIEMASHLWKPYLVHELAEEGVTSIFVIIFNQFHCWRTDKTWIECLCADK